MEKKLAENLICDENIAKIMNALGLLCTAVTRGHFDAWSTDQEFPIVIAL